MYLEITVFSEIRQVHKNQRRLIVYSLSVGPSYTELCVRGWGSPTLRKERGRCKGDGVDVSKYKSYLKAVVSVKSYIEQWVPQQKATVTLKPVLLVAAVATKVIQLMLIFLVHKAALTRAPWLSLCKSFLFASGVWCVPFVPSWININGTWFLNSFQNGS